MNRKTTQSLSAAQSDSESLKYPPTGNTRRTGPENNTFYPALDGLRALAFLMVFGQHYLSLAWGWTGVNIFFVLSGFLITGILFDTRDAPFRARTFYIRRTLRIFPLYYGVFLGLLLLSPLAHWQWDRYWTLWPLYLGNFLRFFSAASLQPNTPLEMAADAHLATARLVHFQLYLGHFWSLCVEEQFYLIWPCIVFWIRDRKKLIALCLSFVILVPILRVALSHTAAPWLLQTEFLYRFTLTQADALLLGGLCALLWRGRQKQLLQIVARVLALVGTLTIILYFLLVIGSWKLEPGSYPHWVFTGGLLFVNVYAAALIICALSPTGWVTHLFCLRPMRWIGRLTYGAYIFHDILHDLYKHIAVLVWGPSLRQNLPLWSDLTAAIALPATLLLAYFSFRFFETPFLNLKARWTTKVSANSTEANS